MGKSLITRLKDWMPWAKRVISAAVVAAVAFAAYKAVNQLDKQTLDWSQVRLFPIAASIVAYIFSMSSGWLFWHFVLVRMRQLPSFRDSFRAFFFGQLAKYIPGKAMVVVVRASTVAGPTVKASVAAISVFVETLTWLAIAAAISFLMIAFNPQSDVTWKLAAAFLFLATVVPTFPPIFRLIVAKLGGKKFQEARQDVVVGINFRTTSMGWLILLVGWGLGALSLWFVLMAIPGPKPVAADWWLCLTVVTLATVIGFVSFLPGGIGVRELVMVPLLGAQFGPTKAIVAAIVLRLVWIVSELLVNLLIVVAGKRKPEKTAERSDASNSRTAML